MTRTPHRGCRAFHVYVGGIISAGCFVLVSAVGATDLQRFAGPSPAAFWLFALCLLGTEVRPIKWLERQEGGELTVSWTFAYALLLVAPAAGALLCMAFASLAGDLFHRKHFGRAVFNAAQVTLSLASAAVILEAFAQGQVLLTDNGPSIEWLAVAALAAGAGFVLNGVFIAVVLALHDELPVWSMIRSGVSLNLSTDGMLLALAPIFVVVARQSLVLLPLLLVTAWAVYRSAREALTREHDANHDQLTGLPNRRLFQESATAALEHAERRGQSLALVILDLDGFKGINDRLGHHIGDLVLADVARRLTAAKRATDFVARLGGDEFGLLLPHVESAAAASGIASRLLAELERPCVVLGFPVSVGGSFGIALFPDHGDDIEILVRHADVAMYRAKTTSDAGVQIYSGDGDGRGRGRLSLLGELQRAIESDQLLLDYQPQVDMRAQAVVGVEALVRWDHPRLGRVVPAEFVPMAEHTELMAPLTEYVLRHALGQCAGWQREGIPLAVAINAAARNLHDPRFPELVERVLHETGVSPQWLELEITENTVMADPRRTMSILTALRELGVTLAIDNFGTGYSSLSNLRELPIDRLKIDRSFVAGTASNVGDGLIVRSIVDLAHNLGLGTVAEGVEDLPTWRALADLGCDVGQGYFVAEPLSPTALTTWLLAREQPGALDTTAVAS